MRKRIIGLVMAASFVLVMSAQAHGVSKHAQDTVVGELVDTGCYSAHLGKGAHHVECATMCINQGMPMGVLTKAGVLYLVTMDHDDPDSYNKLKAMAGKIVAVRGHVTNRSGMKAIEITGFKSAV
jgi:hypothetical protein